MCPSGLTEMPFQSFISLVVRNLISSLKLLFACLYAIVPLVALSISLGSLFGFFFFLSACLFSSLLCKLTLSKPIVQNWYGPALLASSHVSEFPFSLLATVAAFPPLPVWSFLTWVSMNDLCEACCCVQTSYGALSFLKQVKNLNEKSTPS